MRDVNPERVRELVNAHRLVIGGLRGWNELLLLRKFVAGELNDSDVEFAQSRLAKLETQQSDLEHRVRAVVNASKVAKPRAAMSRLLSDGLVVGGLKDQEGLEVLAAGRNQLEAILLKSSSTPVIEGDGLSTELPSIGDNGPEQTTVDGRP